MLIRKILYLLLLVPLLGMSNGTEAAAQEPSIFVPSNLHIELAAVSTAHDSLIVPFFISEGIYKELFTKNTAPSLALQVYLYDTDSPYTSQKIIDLSQGEQDYYPADQWLADGQLVSSRYRFSAINHFLQFDTTKSFSGYHLIAVVVHIPHLWDTHRNLSTLNFTARLYGLTETLFKVYSSTVLHWKNQKSNLILTPEIESYIQAGGLTCEFASAKTALAMLGVYKDEVQDLIPLFPQAAVSDMAKDPHDYFLGDYSFQRNIFQQVYSNLSPLGGYGLHLGQPYLQKIILPFAPASELRTFSFADLDAALTEGVPVILQGVQIAYDTTVLGGRHLQVNEYDQRGLVTGEHTYVIYARNADGSYRMKDPYKSRFKSVPASVIQKSIDVFQRFGAVANMVIVRTKPAIAAPSGRYWQNADGKVVLDSE